MFKTKTNICEQDNIITKPNASKSLIATCPAALHADIQPLEIYHFGGDEVAHGAWMSSDVCNKFLLENPPYRVTHGKRVTPNCEIRGHKS